MAFLIFIIVLLFILAITDLIVGVSNDAVNFLNSAIGSRVASFKTIIIIASAGVILGAVFSSGIMEIARTGIFKPQYFTLDKLLYIFLAVMLTDIVLLDIFNTLGLPTSTTVSIIFELLGAAFVAGILFSIEKNEPTGLMFRYINAGSVFNILLGIFLSIIIAFTIGIIVQYLCRLVFTFDYESRLKKYGAIYAGIGITAIIYFLLIKGLKGTTLISEKGIEWVSSNQYIILLALFVSGTAICKILQTLWQVNPLRIVVLLGTFSLAMAFAGNDLVNFIGVPITGFLAFQHWKTTGMPAELHYQEYLAGNDVIVPNYMLLIAGAIMALTLFISSKAKNVTETEVKLSSQQEGEERFQPNAVSRSVVKSSMLIAKAFKLIMPSNITRFYNISFEKSKIRQATIVHNKPAFDLVRASANLVIASSIIAVATSFKLPLSTTYVSFMVAMGTSLADKAWGRESAVYRVAGVLSVIGGWFITAIIAFIFSGILVFILIKTAHTGVIIVCSIVAIYILLSHVHFSKLLKKRSRENERLKMINEKNVDIIESNKSMIIQNLQEINQHYNDILDSVRQNNISLIISTYTSLQQLHRFNFKMRAQTIRHIKELEGKDKKASQILLFSADLVEDMYSAAIAMGEETKHHIQNLHELPGKEYMDVIMELKHRLNAYLALVVMAIQKNSFDNMPVIKIARDDIRTFINDQLDNRLVNIRIKKPTTKQAVLETTILLQSRDILAIVLRIFNLYRKYAAKKADVI